MKEKNAMLQVTRKMRSDQESNLGLSYKRVSILPLDHRGFEVFFSVF